MNDYTIIHAIGVDKIAEILGIKRYRALALKTRKAGGIAPRHRARLYYYILQNRLPVPAEFLLGGADWLPLEKPRNPVILFDENGNWAGVRYPKRDKNKVVWGFAQYGFAPPGPVDDAMLDGLVYTKSRKI